MIEPVYVLDGETAGGWRGDRATYHFMDTVL